MRKKMSLLAIAAVLVVVAGSDQQVHAETYTVSCAQLGHPNCFYQVQCDSSDSGCILGGAACDAYCSPNEPFGGFDPNGETQDCPNENTRPQCCATEQWDCEIECEQLTNPAYEEECKQGCNSEYWGCRGDGVFVD
jgi:hypothetical protein